MSLSQGRKDAKGQKKGRKGDTRCVPFLFRGIRPRVSSLHFELGAHE